MTRSDDLNHRIRDAATPVPRRVGQEPAQQMLEGIVRTDRQRRPEPAVPSAARRRPRLALAGLAAAVAAGGALALGLAGGGPAYASWTPDPSPLSAQDARDIVNKCMPAQQAAAARTVIGERRGEYAYVNAVTTDGSHTCFRDHDGTVRESSILAVLTAPGQLGTQGIELYGWGQLGTDEGYVRLMSGHLGSQVTAVDIALSEKNGKPLRTAHATVDNGYFLAWYPEGDQEANSDVTTLTLHLADGRTVDNLKAGDLYEKPKLD